MAGQPSHQTEGLAPCTAGPASTLSLATTLAFLLFPKRRCVSLPACVLALACVQRFSGDSVAHAVTFPRSLLGKSSARLGTTPAALGSSGFFTMSVATGSDTSACALVHRAVPVGCRPWRTTRLLPESAPGSGAARPPPHWQCRARSGLQVQLDRSQLGALGKFSISLSPSPSSVGGGCQFAQFTFTDWGLK